jgi:hypothetical protein
MDVPPPGIAGEQQPVDSGWSTYDSHYAFDATVAAMAAFAAGLFVIILLVFCRAGSWAIEIRRRSLRGEQPAASAATDDAAAAMEGGSCSGAERPAPSMHSGKVPMVVIGKRTGQR